VVDPGALPRPDRHQHRPQLGGPRGEPVLVAGPAAGVGDLLEQPSGHHLLEPGGQHRLGHAEFVPPVGEPPHLFGEPALQNQQRPLIAEREKRLADRAGEGRPRSHCLTSITRGRQMVWEVPINGQTLVTNPRATRVFHQLGGTAPRAAAVRLGGAAAGRGTGGRAGRPRRAAAAGRAAAPGRPAGPRQGAAGRTGAARAGRAAAGPPVGRGRDRAGGRVARGRRAAGRRTSSIMGPPGSPS